MSEQTGALDPPTDEYLTPLLMTVQRLKLYGLQDGVRLVLPADVMRGLTQYAWIPVLHADVAEPMVALPGISARDRDALCA